MLIEKIKGKNGQNLKSALFLTTFASGISFSWHYLGIQKHQKDLAIALLGFIVTTCFFLPKRFMKGKLTYFWRTIYGMCLFYLFALVFMIFWSREDVIEFLQNNIDPTLQLIDYQELSYAQNCTLFNSESSNPFENVLNASFDLFALGHFLGWFTKTLILRDFKLVMFASITFEAVEYSLRNVLNNFKECWWDHLILDFSVFNFIGIICGFIVLDLLGWERYRWSLRRSTSSSLWLSFKSFWSRLDLSELQPCIFSNLKDLLKITFFILIILANDLTIFFLKYLYRIPPSHYLNFLRLIVVGFLCVRSVIEYYTWLHHKGTHEKINLYLLLAILALQGLVIYKHSEGELSHAYFDENGMFVLAALAFGYLVIFAKIGISDFTHFLKNNKSKKCFRTIGTKLSQK